MTTILKANGLLEIPEEFRKADALKLGQRFEIERVGQGKYQVRVEHGFEATAPDLVTWLQACPEKDWWVETNHSKSTSLKPYTLFDE